MKYKKTHLKEDYLYFDRDLSWLSFNERVLDEAQLDTVPLMERIRFLGIYSSNLDEFYRVRMPSLMALERLKVETRHKSIRSLLSEINATVVRQQKYFGSIIENQIIQCLREHNIYLIHNEPIPEILDESLRHYFIYRVSAYLRITSVAEHTQFSPENNKLYMLVIVQGHNDSDKTYIVNIPSDVLPRFYSHDYEGTQYVVYLDDIVKGNLHMLFPEQVILGSYTFKTTRNAEMDIQEELRGSMMRKIEKKIPLREFGNATRFLYEPGIPEKTLKLLRKKLSLLDAQFVPGGTYHNLKDLSSFPLKGPTFSYEPWSQTTYKIETQTSLFKCILEKDVLIHPPYHHYDTILRFFNEASIDPAVEKIYVTLYRIANESRIGDALISAAKNGKKVMVFVELKARFDEANNIKWSKRMKSAGVRIIESIPGLKVHAKIALVKRRQGTKAERLGIIATGNFNESTAQYYTDHVLMTANPSILKDVESLFSFLKKRKKVSPKNEVRFRHLLVGQFNLQQQFLDLIDREIAYAEKNVEASIIIKINNLEERTLISKLYEASQKGVKIQLIVRSICCLVPGIKGMSENISVKRIIDRYLEHGRVFIFNNGNNSDVYIGSSDWMNRNIYARIEVCVPVYDVALKRQLLNMLNMQLNDNHQAVWVDENCSNVRITCAEGSLALRSQKSISTFLFDSASPEIV